jgi:cytochrome c oxidase cbb3-type subunit III
MTTRPLLVVVVLLGTVACERETRRYREMSPADARAETVKLSTLQPGRADPPVDKKSPYEENAYGQAEGKRLFSAYNCNGCHALGGGGMGPALMDDKWIYGGEADQIYSTIVQGRPNGMPTFAGRIPNHQVWQLVSFIQSMSGNVPKDVAPGRDDDLSAKKPELRQERQRPKQTGHR